VDTKFHIDYQWWEQSGRNFRLYLRDQLCTECRDRFKDHRDTEDVDWIDPETGEVQRTDALWECLPTRCTKDPDYINDHLSLTAACFRAFLSNINAPLSPSELNQLLPWKPARTILQTLGGKVVYLGLRPVRE